MDDVALLPVATQVLEKDIWMTGIGTPYYAADLGRYYFAELSGLRAHIHPSDELLNVWAPSQGDHLIAVTQSGETFDTIEALRFAAEAGATSTALTNVYSSTAYRLSTHPLYQRAGREVSVATTKSVVSQAAILLRLALLCAREAGRITDETYLANLEDLSAVPDALSQVLRVVQENIAESAKHIATRSHLLVIGRGLLFPVAMESALKLKELTYIHAEGMSAGFLKHGTLSLIDEAWTTIALVPNPSLKPDLHTHTLSSISEIQARGGEVIVFGNSGSQLRGLLGSIAFVELPSINGLVDPLIHLVAGQLLAYHTAAVLGRDIDMPRSLAKAVTVR